MNIISTNDNSCFQIKEAIIKELTLLTKTVKPKNEESIKKRFQSLTLCDFSGIKPTKRIINLYQKILSKHPEWTIDPHVSEQWVTVNVKGTDISSKIPSNLLSLQSESFRRAFPCNNLELELKNNQNDFLEFLKTGNIEITINNFSELHELAIKYNLPYLLENCYSAIQNVDILVILKYAVTADDNVLKGVTLKKIAKYFFESEFDELLQEVGSSFQELAPEMKEIWKVLKKNDHGGNWLNISIKSELIIRDFTDEMFEDLNKINQLIPIKELSIFTDINRDQLLKLMNCLNHVTILLIKDNSIIDELCEEISENLKSITLENFTALRTVKALQIKKIKFHNCPVLTNVQSPKVKDFFAYNTALSILDLPEATTVSGIHCPNLKTIIANESLKVDCRESPIENLIALKAQYTYFEGRLYIRDFQAPSAEVILYECPDKFPYGLKFKILRHLSY
jgi:hypothetical protein